MPGIHKIVLIGAGNLATSLALELVRKGYRVLQVVNRTPDNGKRLAKRAGAVYEGDPSKMVRNADLYILAVRDDAMEQLLRRIHPVKRLLIHMSGSKEAAVLGRAGDRTGVIYPVQTFSKDHPVRFRHIPLCVQAKNRKDEKLLLAFASTLSEKVIAVTEKQRNLVHLAAVFANNFPNFMVVVARSLLEEQGIRPGILNPLIRRTSRNALQDDPAGFQTGPAIRGDRKILEKHLHLLDKKKEFRKIYQLLSEGITKYYKNDDKL